MGNPETGFTLQTRQLGPLPILHHFLHRLRVPALLEQYVPCTDRRLKLAPAAALGVVIRNIAVRREPVYGLGSWAAPFDEAVLGLSPGEADRLNDDRVGRSLERLFHADRASLLTELMLHTIGEFGIDCSQLHNDSTSITLQGAYTAATGKPKAGTPTTAIARGHNKDHRPDLKQLLWILTVSADGAVPVAYRLADGNTTDDTTHVATWDGLVALLGRADFLYVADAKLCTTEAMAHIASAGGRFVTVLPRTRREEGFFREWIQTHDAGFVEVLRLPGHTTGDPDRVWSACPAPTPSAEGYRIVWVRSSTKIERDKTSRQARIEAAVKALDALAAKAAGPRARVASAQALHTSAEKILARHRAERWISIQVGERAHESFTQDGPGRPGPSTRYRKSTRARFELTWTTREDRIAADAASDGCFPLITNDQDMTPGQVLAAYRYQPNLEKRHAVLKGVQLVAPVYLKDVGRIEGLMFCYYLSLLLHALIEREIRNAMRAADKRAIPLYPEDRDSAAPTTARIVEIFTGVARSRLYREGELVQTFDPELTPVQRDVLNLLGVPLTTYQATPD